MLQISILYLISSAIIVVCLTVFPLYYTVLLAHQVSAQHLVYNTWDFEAVEPEAARQFRAGLFN